MSVIPFRKTLSKPSRYGEAFTVANVSEGDVSISVNDKDILINTANSVYAKYDEPLIGVSLQPTVENLCE